MSSFVVDPGERSELVTPIGVLLRDDFTAGAPFGIVRTKLDIQEGAGWRETKILASRSLSGVLTYPKLERRAEPVGSPPRRYRIRVEADFYVPGYRSTVDGVEFNAFPYNDQVLPSQFATEVTILELLPSPLYPYPTHVPVLRGVIEDAAGDPVSDALVTQGGGLERVLSDGRGEFALPLRWVAPNVITTIDVVHQRTGMSGATNITLPGALGINHTITIS